MKQTDSGIQGDRNTLNPHVLRTNLPSSPSELPVQIARPLRVKIAMYRHRGLLECQVSRPNAQVRWYKNGRELTTGKKYQLISQDIYRQLTIDDVCSSDEDTYTCDAGDDETSCQLLVEGEMLSLTCYIQCFSYFEKSSTSGFGVSNTQPSSRFVPQCLPLSKMPDHYLLINVIYPQRMAW